MSSVLFDLNNLAIRCLFSKEVIQSDNEVDWELWKYSIVSSIYGVFFQIKDLDEIVLAVDSKHTWRKIYYPRYKEKRQSKREETEIDWEEYEKIYFNSIKENVDFDNLDYSIFEDSCLLCSENIPDKCHRRLLAEYIAEKLDGKVNIYHLKV